jgi:hypothetical protein
VTESIDDILIEIRSISDRLSSLDDGDPERRSLEARRTDLRAQAAAIADGLRHPVSVETEIAMLEARLEEIDELRIRAGYNEKHLGRTIQDPGAYRHGINARITRDHAAEIDDITRRLAHLRSLASGEDP